MRTIIAGSRDIFDPKLLEEAIIESAFKITEVISGGAFGVDALGETYSLKKLKKKATIFEAKWKDISVAGAVIRTNAKGYKYNAKAGHDRNQQMAEYAAGDPQGGQLIAIQKDNSTGTADMIKRATAAGLNAYVKKI